MNDKKLYINRLPGINNVFVLYLFGINILFISLTAVFPYIHNDFLKWNVINHFNLSGEMNLAAWWSGSLLLWSAALAYQLATRNPESKTSWQLLSICFALLSLDEIGSLHERVGNLSGGEYILLISALIGGIIFSLACWSLWKRKQNQNGILLIFLGAVLFATAAPNEYIEHLVNWPYYLEGARVAFEEGLEISGMLICLIGITRYQPMNRQRGFVPELMLESERLPQLLRILTIGYLIHIGISWIVIKFLSIDFRGNPAVWYFMAVFFMLALVYSWEAFFESGWERYVFFSVSIYFLFLSAGSLYFILPRFNSILHRLWLLNDSDVMLGCQLISLFLIFRLIFKQVTRDAFLKFLILAIVLGVSFLTDSQFLKYIVAGLFALVVAYLFLPKPTFLVPEVD